MANKILFIIDKLELKYFEYNKLVTDFWLIKEFLDRNEEVYISKSMSESIKKDDLAMSTMINGLKAANGIETSFGTKEIISKPPLITLNGFRKQKQYI